MEYNNENLYNSLIANGKKEVITIKSVSDQFILYSKLDYGDRYSNYYLKTENDEKLLLNLNQTFKNTDNLFVSKIDYVKDQIIILLSIDGSFNFNLYVKKSQNELELIEENVASFEILDTSVFFVKKLEDNYVLYEFKDCDKFQCNIFKSIEKYIYLKIINNKLFVILRNYESSDYFVLEKGHISPLLKDQKINIRFDSLGYFKNSIIIQTSDYHIFNCKKQEMVFSSLEEELIDSFLLIENFLVIFTRKDFEKNILIFDLELNNIIFKKVISNSSHRIDIKHFVQKSMNNIFYIMESVIVPPTLYQLNLKTFESKQYLFNKNIVNSNEYIEEVYYAQSLIDNEIIPIYVSYKKTSTKKKVLIDSYGAYGAVTKSTFNKYRLSLLECGIVFIEVACRGSGDKNQSWYKDGTGLNRKNTFYDLYSSIIFIQKEMSIKNKNICLMGISAGGINVGFILNNYPKICKAAILNFPNLSVLNSLCDGSSKAKMHFNENGNPNIPKELDYIKSYDPILNIRRQFYPSILLTLGGNDKNVSTNESIKWLELINLNSTNKATRILNLDRSIGHFSSTSLNKQIEKYYIEYNFILTELS